MGWPRFLPQLLFPPPLVPWIEKGKRKTRKTRKTLPWEQMDKLITRGGDGEQSWQGAANTNEHKLHLFPPFFCWKTFDTFPAVSVIPGDGECWR